jgi:uncharacterized protein (DUF2147 family)
MTPPARRPDIDWLRIGATWLLFVFHGAKVFDPAPFFHVRNAETSMGMLVLAGFIGLWHMPLFFLLAGWSLAAPLRARGAAGFVRERAARLLVPLVAGSASLGPVMKYIELRGGLDLNATGLRVAPALQDGFRQVIPQGLGVAPPFDAGFLEFLPGFFTTLERFTWGHLWFLAYLFVFSVAWLPLFRALLRRQPPARAARAWVYAPLVPLVLVQLVLRPHWPGIQNLYDDWANVGYFSTFLLAGFVLAWAPALEAALVMEWRRALAIAGGATVVLLLVVLGAIPSPAVALAGSAVAGWCWVVALIGAARASLRRPAPAALVESALPIYILHQPALIVVGWFVVLPLPLGVWPKFALLVALSMGLTIAVYARLVRPFAAPRFLLGMKQAARPIAPVAAGRVATAALLAAIPLSAAPAGGATPEGLWYAEGGAAQVEITRCAEALCGRVVWLRSPLDEDGCALRDGRNPDPALRTRPVLGLEVLRGLRPEAQDTWTGGTIYDPSSGRTYRCELRLDGADRLRLRGYVGVSWLGRTTRWVRVGRENLFCR